MQLKFDVTAAGVVENVSVVESSDAHFEDVRRRAVSKWRYLPRIVAGKRVGAEGRPHDHSVGAAQRRGSAARSTPSRRETRGGRRAHYAAFSGGLEVALDRLAADDLRGAELQLDEMQAALRRRTAAISGASTATCTRCKATTTERSTPTRRRVAIYARSRAPATMGPWVPLANLYFARHQYDMALKTLLRPKAPERRARLTARPDAAALMRRSCNALGVTEETLR